MALSNMVGNLTKGKKKYVNVEAEIDELIAQGSRIIAELQMLVDKDAEVFLPLSKAYGLPTDTPEQMKIKEETIENCSKVACSVPMEIMRKAYEGIKIHQRMGQIGSTLAISDVGCGVALLKAALISGSLNVLININSIKNQTFVKATTNEMNSLLKEGGQIADDTLQMVINKLGKR
jgi:formiminotetrahydrofolate cyclodeaminase